MTDFEAYAKRQKRLKALEQVYLAAKAVMNVNGPQSEKIRVFYELQKAIEVVDKLPPLHISVVDKDKD